MSNSSLNEIRKILEQTESDAKKLKSADGKAETVLTAPGFETVKAAANSGKKATHPEDEAKETSKKSTPHQEEKDEETDEDEEDDEKDDSSDNEDEDEKDNDDNDKEEKKSKLKEEEISIEEDIKAIFGADLTEEFQTKAKTVFEAALSRREAKIRQDLAEEFETNVIEGIAEAKAELAVQLDKYINYITEEWMNENRLAVETGIKNEISESLLEGMRKLFLEHNIVVPESKVDVVEELTNELNSLRETLDHELVSNVELSEQLKQYKKKEIIYTVGEDLSQTQLDKFVTLVESISFDNEEEYTKNLKTIKESYLTKSKSETKKTNKTLIADEFNGINSETENITSTDETVNRLAEHFAKFKK